MASDAENWIFVILYSICFSGVIRLYLLGFCVDSGAENDRFLPFTILHFWVFGDELRKFKKNNFSSFCLLAGRF
jgi:hypothetical protein